jgi:deoxyribodipyrimidine photo-lyase
MASMQKLLIPCDKHERLHYIKRQFPEANGADLIPKFAGGRGAAFKKLHAIDAVAYNKNRNFLNGAVTHLSPYLRHGCITLREAFDDVKSRFGKDAEKLLFEFAWRDYWRRVWYQEGDKILSEMEPPKVAISHLPLNDFVLQGKTGLPCMDGFIGDLLDSGYVHNHGRMWLASYIVHHLKMDWREAADWFEAHLLDGDTASNHLSWQWVTSTFSSKPYFFNKENLSRYTGAKFCGDCKANCPFDASYEQLNERLFSKTLVPIAKRYSAKNVVKQPTATHPNLAVFVHDEMLSVAHPLLAKPYPKIFVFDPALHGRWSLNRLQFVADCLNDMETVEVWQGDTYEVLMERGVGQVVTQDTPNLAIKAVLAPFLPEWQREVPLVEVDLSEKRLKRFSRYWEKVGPLVLGDAEYRKP